MWPKGVLIYSERGEMCRLKDGGFAVFHSIIVPSGIFCDTRPMDNQERLDLWRAKKQLMSSLDEVLK